MFLNQEMNALGLLGAKIYNQLFWELSIYLALDTQEGPLVVLYLNIK